MEHVHNKILNLLPPKGMRIYEDKWRDCEIGRLELWYWPSQNEDRLKAEDTHWSYGATMGDHTRVHLIRAYGIEGEEQQDHLQVLY